MKRREVVGLLAVVGGLAPVALYLARRRVPQGDDRRTTGELRRAASEASGSPAESVLRRVFSAALRSDTLISMIVAPAEPTEWAVGVRGVPGAGEAFHLSAQQSVELALWLHAETEAGVSASSRARMAGVSKAVSVPSAIGVDERTVRVDEELSAALCNAWARAVHGALGPDPGAPVGVDGTVYRFAMTDPGGEVLRASAWSLGVDGSARRLVEAGRMLARFVACAASERDDVRRSLLRAAQAV